ncbi:MAG TPA: zf-HC2 domain-containing protein [Chloroflexia bacterium]|jgi:anti-sigma factor RsiW
MTGLIEDTMHDEGRLRAYLDGELAGPESAELKAHLEGCAGCQAQIDGMRKSAIEVSGLLGMAVQTPDAHAALSSLRKALSDEAVSPGPVTLETLQELPTPPARSHVSVGDHSRSGWSRIARSGVGVMLAAGLVLGLALFWSGLPGRVPVKPAPLGTSASPQATLIENGAVANHETPTVQAVSSRSPLIPERSELAPPYDEIRQHVHDLVVNRDKEKDLRVDKHGFGNRELEAALGEYQLSLRGMKVQNWKGWIRKINSDKLQDPEDDYIINVYVTDPELEVSPRAYADLFDVSREQLERLIAAQASEGNSRPWYSVVYSGTLVGVTIGAQVVIYDASIEINTRP